MTTSTIRLTVAQAVITYLSRQYSVADGDRRRLIPATLGIFGHGNVAGLGQALDQLADQMPFIQGRNEQSLVHIAIGYAKPAAARHPGRHRLDRPRRAEHGHRGRAGDGQPAARAAAARRQLCHPAPGPGAAAAATPDRGRCDRQRRFRPVSPVLRPDHPARAAAHRAARGHARADRPGGHRRRGAVAAPGRAVPRLRLPGRVLRRAGLGDPPARRPTRTRSKPSPRCSPPAAADHRRRRRHLLRRDRRTGGAGRRRSASRLPRPSPARARCRPQAGGRSAASAWRAPRRPTTWSGRPTSCSRSGPG